MMTMDIWDYSRETRWTTDDEISFVRLRLGKSSERGQGVTRIEALRRYLKSLDLRSEWGGIDPEKVREFVEYQIGQEEARNGHS